jgi:hypothetical protein
MPAPSVTRLARPALAKSPRPRLLPRALVAAREHDAHCRAVRPPIAAPPVFRAKGPLLSGPIEPLARHPAKAGIQGRRPRCGQRAWVPADAGNDRPTLRAASRHAHPRASTPWTDGTTRGKPLDGDRRGNVAARRLARFVRHIPRTQRGSAPSARSDLERGPITRPRGKPRIGCRGTSGPLFLRRTGRKGRRRLTESEQGGSGTLRQAPTSAMTRLGSKSDAAGQCR